jgi:hypothetical protein
MWIVNIIPTWVYYGLFFSGVAVYLISSLLNILPQNQLFKIGSAAVIFLSVYFIGANANNEAWLAKVKELEHKVALAEEKSKSANTVISDKVNTKIRTIKETVYVNAGIIENTIKPQIDATCTLPVSSIVLHDSAAQATVASGPSSTDGSPSGVAPSKLLETVVENYGSCQENTARLRAWQEWYKTQKKIYESVP